MRFPHTSTTAHRRVYDCKRVRPLLHWEGTERRYITSLSSCFANRVICFIINLGASSESLTMNAETDFGPLVSLELNSLFPSSLATN